MGYKYQGLFEQCAAKIKLYHSELTSKKKFLDDLIVKAKALESEIIKFLSKPAPSAPEREPLKNASPDKIAAGILAEFNSLVQESYNKLLDRYDQACLELKKMVSIWAPEKEEKSSLKETNENLLKCKECEKLILNLLDYFSVKIGSQPFIFLLEPEFSENSKLLQFFKNVCVTLA